MSFSFLAACASTKPYVAKDKSPNLTVQVQMEREIFQRELAELYIYEVRGKCEQFYHGYVSLEEGKNSVALPVGRDLIVAFVRSNVTYGSEHVNEDAFRLRPQPGQQYRLSLRERKGSREVLFSNGARETSSTQMPGCKVVKYTE